MAHEIREAGGITDGRLGVEILYLLPDHFVEFYGRLFHMALTGAEGGSVMHGRSGGVDKAKGATGMVTGSNTKLQAGGSASGAGKRFKRTGMFIRDEKMLGLKRKVDEDLINLTRWGVTEMIGLQGGGSRGGGPTPGLQGSKEPNPPILDTGSPTVPGELGGSLRCTGLRRSYIDRSADDPNWTRPLCGIFLDRRWIFCPQCGTKVGRTE